MYNARTSGTNPSSFLELLIEMRTSQFMSDHVKLCQIMSNHVGKLSSYGQSVSVTLLRQWLAMHTPRKCWPSTRATEQPAMARTKQNGRATAKSPIRPKQFAGMSSGEFAAPPDGINSGNEGPVASAKDESECIGQRKRKSRSF